MEKHKWIFGSKNAARFVDIVIEVPPQSVVKSIYSNIDVLKQASSLRDTIPH